ncbi:hypothetical protein FRB96_002870 [Tulasnella sp. 330]|nr:hypothetical protein FRB96_002870 [Tulasnella sp. 330]KAG8884973.1 hypothetical protein FRB97_002801 [Tulasnella sp. 331]KAG8889283.1 hypothetical protein FRB98_005096 [Tulasnella sp. 332]
MENPELKKALDPTVDFAAGTLGGMAGLVVGHPLDTVKVRLQTPEIAFKYTGGTMHAVRTIFLEERIKGLYKGVTSPLAGAAFLNGIVFGSYGFFMKLQGAASLEAPTLGQVALAGAGSGIVASLVTTPTDLMKIRQQTMLLATGVPSTRQMLSAIALTEGLRGLYRGITVTCMRDCGYGVYFATYEGTCRLFKAMKSSDREDTQVNHSSLVQEAGSFESPLTWPELMTSGGLAGAAGWLCTFPLDVVKSQIQAHTGLHPCPSAVSLLQESYRSSGLRGLFAGLSPTLLRAVPVNMVTFLVFESVVAGVHRPQSMSHPDLHVVA